MLARLEELDLSRKTVVLFTSDHGYNIGHHGIHTKGNGFWVAGGVSGPKRPNMWETSIRVPLAIRWPGVVRPGSELRQPVSNIDTFVSVLGLLGVPIPEGVKQQGMDFSPLLRGREVPWRDTVFAQYDLHNGGLAFMRMIRTPPPTSGISSPSMLRPGSRGWPLERGTPSQFENLINNSRYPL